MSTQTRNTRRLLRIMERLRGPGGCPWDREQTHQSIRHNLIEECYECLEALDSFTRATRRQGPGRRRRLANARQAFRDELGDLLLQVVFHAQMAEDRGHFEFDDIARGIADKLVRRHPHVFGQRRVRDSHEVLSQWEDIKRAEKGTTAAAAGGSIFHTLPRALPALLKADKVQRKAARVGFDWKHVDDVVAKVEEELRELKGAMASRDRRQFEEELGDLLFAAVNLARFEGLQAEELLNRCITKFVGRFQEIERSVHASGRRLEDCTLEELDALWESAKHRGRARRRNARRHIRRL